MTPSCTALRKKLNAHTFHTLLKPARNLLSKVPCLKARGNRPLQMTFEDQLDVLVYFHLEEHKSGRHLLQALEEDDFAREVVAPEGGIKKSSFFEAINTRGLEQLVALFDALSAEATAVLPKVHGNLGDLIGIDGSLIDAVLSMHWADYRDGAKKAKTHLGFNINQGIPAKIFLTDGKADERPFVSQILSEGQTGVMDRYFGTKDVNQTEEEVRVVGYHVDGHDYWVATDRHDLTAEEVATAYKLRWNIETFFGWWKQHFKVYHLIARSRHGLMVQILAGLITYLLLAIYCHNEHKEKVSIKRIWELRFKIKNEAAAIAEMNPGRHQCIDADPQNLYAKT